MYTVISLATFCLLSKLALWAICSCGPALGARAHLAAPKEVLGAQSCGGCLPAAPWTLSNQTLCARAVAGQAAAWRSWSHVRATRPACSSHHAIEEVAKHSGDCAAVPQAHRRRRRRASYHRKPCHLNPLQSLAPPPGPTPPSARPAATLGVCTTVLKKVCRRHGIRRWPQRKLQSLNKLINNLHNAMKSTDGALAPCARVGPRFDAR